MAILVAVMRASAADGQRVLDAFRELKNWPTGLTPTQYRQLLREDITRYIQDTVTGTEARLLREQITQPTDPGITA